MKLSALAILVLAGCAASQPAPMRPWRIEVKTDGGLAGKGVGTYSISSDGRIAVKSMNGKECIFDAPDGAVEQFERLLTDTNRDSWRDSYVPEERCCDRMSYTLTIDEAGRKTTIVWIDAPLPMPDDLAALTDAMVGGPESLRVRYGGECR